MDALGLIFAQQSPDEMNLIFTMVLCTTIVALATMLLRSQRDLRRTRQQLTHSVFLYEDMRSHVRILKLRRCPECGFGTRSICDQCEGPGISDDTFEKYRLSILEDTNGSGNP